MTPVCQKSSFTAPPQRTCYCGMFQCHLCTSNIKVWPSLGADFAGSGTAVISTPLFVDHPNISIHIPNSKPVRVHQGS